MAGDGFAVEVNDVGVGLEPPHRHLHIAVAVEGIDDAFFDVPLLAGLAGDFDVGGAHELGEIADDGRLGRGIAAGDGDDQAD